MLAAWDVYLAVFLVQPLNLLVESTSTNEAEISLIEIRSSCKPRARNLGERMKDKPVDRDIQRPATDGYQKIQEGVSSAVSIKS